MGNVLSKEEWEQVIVLGRLGWSLRRMERATGARQETAGDYLRSAGIALRTPGGRGRKPFVILSSNGTAYKPCSHEVFQRERKLIWEEPTSPLEIRAAESTCFSGMVVPLPGGFNPLQLS
jgi:hypothetical protein